MDKMDARSMYELIDVYNHEGTVGQKITTKVYCGFCKGIDGKTCGNISPQY